MVSELLYAGKTLDQIAGWSTLFMNRVLLLARDQSGRLIPPNEMLPDGVEVDARGMRVVPPDQRRPFTQTYRRVKEAQGLSGEESQKYWDRYLNQNPQLVDLIEMGKRRRKNRSRGKRNIVGA